jgi:hypothetical protein
MKHCSLDFLVMSSVTKERVFLCAALSCYYPITFISKSFNFHQSFSHLQCFSLYKHRTQYKHNLRQARPFETHHRPISSYSFQAKMAVNSCEWLWFWPPPCFSALHIVLCVLSCTALWTFCVFITTYNFRFPSAQFSDPIVNTREFESPLKRIAHFTHSTSVIKPNQLM